MESADRASGPPHCESLRTDQFDVVYYSDDHGDTWHLARNESGASARLAGLDEPALAETPSGGVIVRARNERFHGPGRCDCRGAAESHDGGDTMTGGVTFDAGLPEPVCEGTLLNDLPSGKIFSAMPGFGTDVEKKDGHNGRGNGVVRWSSDGQVVGRRAEALARLRLQLLVPHAGPTPWVHWPCVGNGAAVQLPAQEGYLGQQHCRRRSVRTGGPLRAYVQRADLAYALQVFSLIPTNFSG